MPYQITVSDEVVGKVLDTMDDLNSKQTVDQFVDGWLRSTLGIHEPEINEDFEELDEEETLEEDASLEVLDDTGT